MTDNEKSGTPDNDAKIRALGARWQTAIDAERAGRPPPPDEPENYINEMAIDVVNTPGATLDGALTKLRIALHYNREDGDGDNAYPLGDGTIMRAVVGDLERVRGLELTVALKLEGPIDDLFARAEIVDRLENDDPTEPSPWARHLAVSDLLREVANLKAAWLDVNRRAPISAKVPVNHNQEAVQ